MINRIILMIMDSAGIGALPDAGEYGDLGVNTLGHTAEAVGGLKAPNMASLGLGNIAPLKGVEAASQPKGAFGKMAEVSAGKDTTTGHWEIAGCILERPFSTYPQGFPREVIEEFETRIGRKTLGNVVASGTVIIEELGAEHMKTGYPIVYTSADSVFQIAAHEEVIPIEEQYRMCETAREMLVGEHAVGRVIARPFIGQPGSFKRTERRHDFSLKPVKPTILDKMMEKGLAVMAVGKIKDIYADRGITHHLAAKSNMDGVDKTLEFMEKGERGLIFTNLVDFDMLYGHRNNAKGYAEALEAFDGRLPEIFAGLKADDLLIITADHGCDPTSEGTDHTREYVPLLVYGQDIKSGVNLGVRKSFADVGATIGQVFGIDLGVGTGFLKEIQRDK
ncbi:MAG: phosphopentomutase [Clostridia bacterium]|nr:phosphopentomutase [Clostridia bacterium]